MPYRIMVKPQHITGTFRRGGVEFSKEPTTVESLSPALQGELDLGQLSALLIEEVAGTEGRRDVAAEIRAALGSASLEDARSDLTTRRVAELRDLAARVGVEVADNATKQVVIDALRARL